MLCRCAAHLTCLASLSGRCQGGCHALAVSDCPSAVSSNFGAHAGGVPQHLLCAESLQRGGGSSRSRLAPRPRLHAGLAAGESSPEAKRWLLESCLKHRGVESSASSLLIHCPLARRGSEVHSNELCLRENINKTRIGSCYIQERFARQLAGTPAASLAVFFHQVGHEQPPGAAKAASAAAVEASAAAPAAYRAAAAHHAPYHEHPVYEHRHQPNTWHDGRYDQQPQQELQLKPGWRQTHAQHDGSPDDCQVQHAGGVYADGPGWAVEPAREVLLPQVHLKRCSLPCCRVRYRYWDHLMRNAKSPFPKHMGNTTARTHLSGAAGDQICSTFTVVRQQLPGSAPPPDGWCWVCAAVQCRA